MDSLTKKTRQDGSEVTERRKENIFFIFMLQDWITLQKYSSHVDTSVRDCMLTRGPGLNSASVLDISTQIKRRNRTGQKQAFRDLYDDLIV